MGRACLEGGWSEAVANLQADDKEEHRKCEGGAKEERRKTEGRPKEERRRSEGGAKEDRRRTEGSSCPAPCRGGLTCGGVKC